MEIALQNPLGYRMPPPEFIAYLLHWLQICSRIDDLAKYFLAIPETNMQVQHSEKGGDGFFFIEENGQRLALLAYELTEEPVLIIHHTEVDKALRGQNIGVELVRTAVEYAKEKGYPVSALCPFARKQIEKMPPAS
jgi:predicted GNAT family acetyltransferase